MGSLGIRSNKKLDLYLTVVKPFFSVAKGHYVRTEQDKTANDATAIIYIEPTVRCSIDRVTKYIYGHVFPPSLTHPNRVLVGYRLPTA